MEDLRKILKEHPFFAKLPAKYLDMVVGCASNVRFDAGEYIFKEGQKADTFYLIRHGKVSIETYIPNQGPVVIDTAEAGQVLGWSWLFPPYRWHFDARALELTRAVALDGKCLRKKQEKDHELGYYLMKDFAQIMEEVLQATRLRLLDLYRNPENEHA